MQVEIWSDVVCPWCYIGKRRFEAALARFDHGDAVHVRWRSFELDPAAPVVRDVTVVDHLAAKYGITRADARAMQARVIAVAAGEGLELRFERARSGNTFDAHRLLHLAAERGVQDAVKERLFAAYFTEGEAIGDRTVLARLGVEAGLDAAEAADTLASGAYADAVRADEADARGLGIGGVPFFVVDRAYGASGAQPADVLLRLLERARADSRPVAGTHSGGAACADDCCTP